MSFVISFSVLGVASGLITLLAISGFCFTKQSRVKVILGTTAFATAMFTAGPFNCAFNGLNMRGEQWLIMGLSMIPAILAFALATAQTIHMSMSMIQFTSSNPAALASSTREKVLFYVVCAIAIASVISMMVICFLMYLDHADFSRYQILCFSFAIMCLTMMAILDVYLHRIRAALDNTGNVPVSRGPDALKRFNDLKFRMKLAFLGSLNMTIMVPTIWILLGVVIPLYWPLMMFLTYQVLFGMLIITFLFVPKENVCCWNRVFMERITAVSTNRSKGSSSHDNRGGGDGTVSSFRQNTGGACGGSSEVVVVPHPIN
jgi:uncharacterized membrane protein YgcG